MATKSRLETPKATVLARISTKKPVHIQVFQNIATGETDIKNDPLKDRIYTDIEWFAIQLKALAHETLGLDLADLECERHVVILGSVGCPYVKLVHLGIEPLSQQQIEAFGQCVLAFHRLILTKSREMGDLFESPQNPLPTEVAEKIDARVDEVLEQRGGGKAPQCDISIGTTTLNLSGNLGPRPPNNNFAPVVHELTGVRKAIDIEKGTLVIRRISGEKLNVEFDPRTVDRRLGDSFMDGMPFVFSLLEFRRANGEQAFSLEGFSRYEEGNR